MRGALGVLFFLLAILFGTSQPSQSWIIGGLAVIAILLTKVISQLEDIERNSARLLELQKETSLKGSTSTSHS